MRKKTVAVGVLTIIVLGSFLVANQVNNTHNDTWDNTHWGGDTGEEEYSSSGGGGDGTNGTGDICSGGICSTAIIVFSVILFPSYIHYRKQDGR